jgi:hypothetical protein
MDGVAELADLADVASTAPSDGQVLTYDTVNGWQPEDASGGIDGSGTANYVAKWSDSDTLTDSVIYEDANGNVGIGTTDASYGIVQDYKYLQIKGGQPSQGGVIFLRTSDDSAIGGFGTDSGSTTLGSNTNHPVTFYTNSVERLRILPTGGLTFNGDTAAANALDDYEEGTWTMGLTFGGASAGITYALNTGTYTKIGRQVTVNGYLALSNKGSSTGEAEIVGLPFTVPNNAANYSAASLHIANISHSGFPNAFARINSTDVALYETSDAGTGSTLDNTNFANNSGIIMTLTYFT